MHVLICGGCGFIGANFVKMLLDERPAWRLTVLDALTYAGNLATLGEVDPESRATFVKGDIGDSRFMEDFFSGMDEPFDAVVNFAAESHVDRSIAGPRIFIETNIMGAFNLLEQVRCKRAGRLVQISTDEVYGSLGDRGAFTETAPLDPHSPYSSSKASADLMVQAYHRTFGVDAVITRCSNNYGPYQFPEKLIPLTIINALQGKPIPVYGRGLNVRDWIHVRDHAAGVLLALEKGEPGEVYNFGGRNEVANIDLVTSIVDILGKDRELILFVTDRPGHDFRYAMDFSKAKDALGFEPGEDFKSGIEATVNWYVEHRGWWEPILKGEHMRFYEEWYGSRVSG